MGKYFENISTESVFFFAKPEGNEYNFLVKFFLFSDLCKRFTIAFQTQEGQRLPIVYILSAHTWRDNRLKHFLPF